MGAINRVLVVDDDAFTQKVLVNAIAERYQVETANDGERAIEMASSWQPDIVLLDVEMPGRNGYEVCDFLKRQKSTSHIPIIFVSGCSSVRERMLGFEVGADDYLVKPCSKELLNAKLEKMDVYIAQKEQLESSYQSAQDTALEAIATSADLGKAVRFIERSYLVPSLDKLSEELVNILRDMQLSASLMFSARTKNYFASTKGTEVAPLEQDLLQMLHTEKRFVDFGCRTQVNYPRVALLIKNMPLEDRNRYGRLKDIIPFVLGAVDAKVRIIDAEQLFKQQNAELGQAVESVRKSLAEIGNMLVQNQSQVGEIMIALNTSLASELHRLGLEEDQETYILDQFDDASQGINQTLECGSNILDTMENVVHQLEHLAVDQHQIITETLTVAAEDQIDTSGDIELF
ncbi:response regulator receiver domain-containing protein [Alteromonadaceae bacterium 2753L.S.0a.02]|nr:response regulator receiver domain-containing protein [Alteromonadaceae bacterium 2753L.S.0a.02]